MKLEPVTFQGKGYDAGTVRGYTVEGKPFTMNVFYLSGGPANAQPVRFRGFYESFDGCGEFDVSYIDEVPWVITVSEGGWL